MTYPTLHGLSGYQLPNGVGTPAQLATVLRLFAEDAAAADMGNVPAKYASMVLLPDGSLTTDPSSLVPDPGADWQPAYLTQVLNARRYLLIAVPRVMSDGKTANWFTTIGAISAPAATAILQTYTAAGKPTPQTPIVEHAVTTPAPTPSNQPPAPSTTPPTTAQAAPPTTPQATAPALPTSMPTDVFPASQPVILPEDTAPSDVPENPSFLSSVPTWAWIAGAGVAGLLLLRRRG